MGNQYRFTKEQIEDFVENNIVDNSGGK